MSYRIEFELSGLPKILANSMQGSWKASHYAKKRWQERVINHVVLMRLKPESPLLRAAISLTRFSTHRPDQDNLAGSFKPVLDGLVKAGVIADDSNEIIDVKWNWEKTKRMQSRIRIIVESEE